MNIDNIDRFCLVPSVRTCESVLRLPQVSPDGVTSADLNSPEGFLHSYVIMSQDTAVWPRQRRQWVCEWEKGLQCPDDEQSY